MRRWLDALASDSRARAVVVSQTLRGAMGSLTGRTTSLAQASDEQAAAEGTEAAPAAPGASGGSSSAGGSYSSDTGDNSGALASDEALAALREKLAGGQS